MRYGRDITDFASTKNSNPQIMIGLMYLAGTWQKREWVEVGRNFGVKSAAWPTSSHGQLHPKLRFGVKSAGQLHPEPLFGVKLAMGWSWPCEWLQNCLRVPPCSKKPRLTIYIHVHITGYLINTKRSICEEKVLCNFKLCYKSLAKFTPFHAWSWPRMKVWPNWPHCVYGVGHRKISWLRYEITIIMS